LNEGLLASPEGFGRKLTLLSAPAGFGKTTLVTAWLRQAKWPLTWFSLDVGDNDPMRFLAHLLVALQRIDPNIGQAAQATVQGPEQPPLELLLTGLLNDIAATPKPFILVLDNYHVIESVPIHQSLSFLLTHLPQEMHLVLATRADPPLPIARLRGQGQLTELNAADLRFSTEEVEGFLKDVMELPLSAEDVAALERRTEGWAVGLQLAALSLQGSEDISGFINAFTGSHRYILDYLTEEVLNRQPEDTQAFLLQTAILDRLTAPLCDAVTGRSDSQRLLEALEAANLFTNNLDEERRWYRYHQLFSDLLRGLLQRQTPQLVPELHRRAGEWYEQNGFMPEAVSHTIAAGEIERAADLVEQTAWPMLTRGESAMLLGWLGALPGQLLRSRPRLGVFYAWALAFAGQLDAVETRLADVEIEKVPGEVAAVRAYVAGVRGDVSGTIRLARLASEYLPEEDLILRAIVALDLGIAYWSGGEPMAASRALTEAVRLSREAGQTFLALKATASLGHVQEMRGLLRQALETHRHALQLGSRQGQRPIPFAGMACVGIATVLYEWNDLDGALRHATEGVELSELGGRVSYVLAGRTVQASVYLARGHMDQASSVLLQAERLAQRHGHAYVMAHIAELRVRLWLEQGNLAAALQWSQEYDGSVMDEGFAPLALEMQQIALARVLVAQRAASGPDESGRAAAFLLTDEVQDAPSLLAGLLDSAQTSGRMQSAIKLLALQAVAFQAQGDVDQAVSVVERALLLAEPEGYVRTFVDEGEPMARLLRIAAARAIAPGYVASLLAALGEASVSGPTAAQLLAEPLTERELEVLHLVAAGLSNQEIAQELVIALSTVKSHINHIYGKLGAKSRVQAVSRAQALGLL
jgi:LuxR family maltose regulon positive regulatory protein